MIYTMQHLLIKAAHYAHTLSNELIKKIHYRLVNLFSFAATSWSPTPVKITACLFSPLFRSCGREVCLQQI